MRESDDVKFMKRCLELASGAEGMTYPNPMVGAVVVHDGKIIGEGFHIKAGAPHAEVNAINSVSEKLLLKKSTLYVNLEPCSHYGKTPPCADFIISSKIPRVVIGTTDTSTKVSGKGADKLRKAGCEVITGVIENECRDLNKRFFTFNEKRRPYIILKWAESADGFIDYERFKGEKSGPAWISGKPERVLVHKWRASEQAILVGAGTVRADRPVLNVREWKGNNPLRIILSASGEIDIDYLDTGTNDTIILFTDNIDSEIKGAKKVKLNNGIAASVQIADYLYNIGIQSLFIEGGAQVLSHFILTGLWDEARVFRGMSCFNTGVKAPLIKGKRLNESVFSMSTLSVYLRE